jgi:hypothetical protein
LDIGASVLHGFFDDKVTRIRIAKSVPDPSSLTPAPPGNDIWVFKPVSPVPVGVLRQVQLQLDKQRISEPIHIQLLKANVDS